MNITDVREDMLQVGATIRILRYRQGFSSAQSFAKHAGVSPASVHQWECGKNISLKNLLLICRALTCTPTDFFKQAFKNKSL